MTRDSIQVAVDGPSASGKSTVSRRVAERMGFMHVDSGMFYRTLTWRAVREGVSPGDVGGLLDLMRRCRWETSTDGRSVLLNLDGTNPGAEIRGEPVRERVSEVAAVPEVRAFIVARLRETVQYGSIVMEGRDIGTVVFPGTPWKFYLDADPAERARRRALEIESQEGRANAAEVMKSLSRRDRLDSSRKAAPLQIALHAMVIDSTSLSIDEVANLIVSRVQAGSQPGEPLHPPHA